MQQAAQANSSYLSSTPTRRKLDSADGGASCLRPFSTADRSRDIAARPCWLHRLTWPTPFNMASAPSCSAASQNYSHTT